MVLPRPFHGVPGAIPCLLQYANDVSCGDPMVDKSVTHAGIWWSLPLAIVVDAVRGKRVGSTLSKFPRQVVVGRQE